MNHILHFLPGKDVYYSAANTGIMSDMKQPNNMPYLLVFTSQWRVAWRPRYRDYHATPTLVRGYFRN